MKMKQMYTLKSIFPLIIWTRKIDVALEINHAFRLLITCTRIVKYNDCF
jgi:hypothetical protein